MNGQPERDPAELLDLLAMAHYAVAALWALLSLVPATWVFVAHEVAGASGLHQPGQPAPLPPSAALTALAVAVVVVSFAGAAFVVWGGLCLASRRRIGVASAAAIVVCLFVPVGTALGAVTWMMLGRQAVRNRFAG